MGEDSLIVRLNKIDADIRHEDDLIGQRMSWLVISQSFLFGSLVTLMEQTVIAGEAASEVKLLHILIPLVGLLLPVLVLVAMVAAQYAMSQWRAEADRICELPEARQLGWPRLRRQNAVSVLGNLLPIVASVGFFLAWVVILIKQT